jgi:hypothetical protein
MSTTDDWITQDLAVVASTSRERLPPIEVTLRALGAAPSTTGIDLALVVVGRVFVARVARAAAGLASFVCMIAMLVWLAVPRSKGWFEQERSVQALGVELLEERRFWLGLLVVAVALAAYVGASGIGARVFERTVRAHVPIEAARRLARRADSWSTAASITGIATFILGFGMFEVVLGDMGLIDLYWQRDPIEVIRLVMLVSLGGAFAATVAGAMFVVRTYGDVPELGSTVWMLLLGVALAVVTVILGVRFDAGPIFVTIANSARPLVAVRVILTAAGAIAVFFTTAGMVLHVRRREEKAIRSA